MSHGNKHQLHMWWMKCCLFLLLTLPLSHTSLEKYQSDISGTQGGKETITSLGGVMEKEYCNLTFVKSKEPYTGRDRSASVSVRLLVFSHHVCAAIIHKICGSQTA